MKALLELADFFEVLACDQEAFTRWQATAKAKAECRTKAATFRDAAALARKRAIELSKEATP